MTERASAMRAGSTNGAWTELPEGFYQPVAVVQTQCELAGFGAALNRRDLVRVELWRLRGSHRANQQGALIGPIVWTAALAGNHLTVGRAGGSRDPNVCAIEGNVLIFSSGNFAGARRPLARFRSGAGRCVC